MRGQLFSGALLALAALAGLATAVPAPQADADYETVEITTIQDQGSALAVRDEVHVAHVVEDSSLWGDSELEKRAGICPHRSLEAHFPHAGNWYTSSFRVAFAAGTQMVFGWIDNHGVSLERYV